MNFKAHRNHFKQLFFTIAGICILACTTGSVAEEMVVAKKTVEVLYDRLIKLEKKINSMVAVPVGAIMPYGGDLSKMENLKNQGWLPCDGEEYSSAEGSKYYALYKVIGTNFGGHKDKNMFNVPDLHGRFVRGVDHKTKRDPDAKNRKSSVEQSGNIGDAVGSVQGDAMQKHTHKVYLWSNKLSKKQDRGQELTNWSGTKRLGDMGAAIEHDGGGEPLLSSETRPKNLYVNWIIKAKKAE